MREIKFRGKNKCGDWVYGNLVKIPNEILIVKSVPFAFKEKDPEHWKIMEYNGIKNSIAVYRVLSETVGEFTGLQDINGKDIYEGDIVDLTIDGGYSVVEFSIGSFVVFEDTELFEVAPQCRIVGNIHDNPELLKEVD